VQKFYFGNAHKLIYFHEREYNLLLFQLGGDLYKEPNSASKLPVYDCIADQKQLPEKFIMSFLICMEESRKK